MRDDIDFWTDRVIHSADNDNKEAFREAMHALMMAVNEIVRSAARQASHDTTAPNDKSSIVRKKYSLPKAK